MKGGNQNGKMVKIYEDKLVAKFRRKDGIIITQGKRQTDVFYQKHGKDLIKVYVKFGTVQVLKYLKDKDGMSVKEALNHLNKIRGKEIKYET